MEKSIDLKGVSVLLVRQSSRQVLGTCKVYSVLAPRHIHCCFLVVHIVVVDVEVTHTLLMSLCHI